MSQPTTSSYETNEQEEQPELMPGKCSPYDYQKQEKERRRQREKHFGALAANAMPQLINKQRLQREHFFDLVKWRTQYPLLLTDIDAIISHVAVVDAKIFLARDLALALKAGRLPRLDLDFAPQFREYPDFVRRLKFVDVYRRGGKRLQLPDWFLRGSFQCIRDMDALDKSGRMPLTKTYVLFQNVCAKKITGPSLWEKAAKATNAAVPKPRLQKELLKQNAKAKPLVVRPIAQERLVINAVFFERDGVLTTTMPAFKDPWKESLPFRRGEIVVICQVHPDVKKTRDLDVDMKVVEDCLSAWLFHALSTRQNTKFALVLTAGFYGCTALHFLQTLKENFAHRLTARLGGPLAAFNFARQPMDLVNSNLKICDEHEYKERWASGGPSKLQPSWELQTAFNILD